MKPFHAHFFLIMSQLSGLMDVIGKPSEGEDDGELRSQLDYSLVGLGDECKDLGLIASLATIQRLRRALAQEKDKQQASFSSLGKELQGRLYDEMKGKFCLALTAEEAEYYQQKGPLFGEEVFNGFPRTIADIEEAGKCLALGRATACVFHLMRVMEEALKVVARKLGIPYAPNWESYIKQIDKKINEPHKDKIPDWKKDEPFYRDLLGDFQAVKWAWRNPTMHIVREYTVEEAEGIFRAIRGFMQRLARKFPSAEEEDKQ